MNDFFLNINRIYKIFYLLIKLLIYRTYESIKLEEQNLRYWCILSFAVGILICFFSNEKIKIILILLNILLLTLSFLFYKITFNNLYKIISYFLLMMFIGYSVAYVKYLKTKNNIFSKSEYNVRFEGKIENVKLSSNETILIVKAINAPNTELYNGKIRIKIKNSLLEEKQIKKNTIYNGGVAEFYVSLIPIKYSSFPNDDSYKNYAKYFDIIASGTAKDFKIINNNYENKSGFFKFFDIQKKRNDIQKRIYEVNNKSVGSGIVIAILTGNNSFIDKKVLQNIRHSGCAHILAISGLHMSIVVSFVFFLFIHLFALFPRIALKYNTKKLAVIPAVLTCLFYLHISNVPISALRSFTMVFLCSLILFFNKSKSSLNIIFITFFLMLLFSPHYLLSPSFQMSFMAVFGLSIVYGSNFTENFILTNGEKYTKYILNILLSSIIATISTVFFEIYHFKQYAWIGLLSNIPVIPLTEFLVLPFGFIGMVFNNTIVGDFFYIIANFFANIVCIITNFTANLPNAFILTKQMTNCQLAIVVFSIILIFLSKSYFLKIVGFIILIFGFISYLNNPKYLLIYDKKLKNIVFWYNNKYFSYKEINNDYINSIWSQNLGIEKISSFNGNEDVYNSDKSYYKPLQCFKENNKIKYCKYNIIINDIKQTFTFYNENKNSVVGVKFDKNRFVII